MRTLSMTGYKSLAQQLPRATGWPLIGELPALAGNPLGYLAQAQTTYGDIYQLNLGVTELMVLNHPRHAQHVLVDNARNYRKGGPIWDSLRTLLGNGLPVSEGDFWLRQRRMMQPHFHRRRLAALTNEIADALAQGLAVWPEAAGPEDPFDVMQGVTQLTMRVIMRALFGTSLPQSDMADASQALAFTLDHLLQGIFTQSLPSWLPVPGRRRYAQAVATIDRVVFDAIDRCRSNPDEGSLIPMLLDMVDAESGEQMTPHQLRDEAVTMFLAGYETTATALAWAFHFLTQDPALLTRLQAETDAVLEGRTPGLADLPQMPYSRQVFQEALRYYSPSWQLTRTAVEADQIDGFAISPGQNVAVMQHTIHHHPEFWPEPARFDPDRFKPGTSADRPATAWIPFGAGQRLCIGQELALMEGQLALTMIAQRFDVRALSGRVARPQAGITLRPQDGVWVEVRAR